METQTRSGAKDFFINLGAIVALYATVASLARLLFVAINHAYPQVSGNYGSYLGSASISWPVASIIVFFPIFLALMWLLEREYRIAPEKQSSGVHRWLTYITLFIAGLTIALDLITVLYYFLDGQELTTGFLLKVLVLLVIAGSIFSYYLSDVLGKLTAKRRVMYRIFSLVIIIVSICWGFVVLGSPHTQRLYKYDEEKVSDLAILDNAIQSYYQNQGVGKLPESFSDIAYFGYVSQGDRIITDSQTGKPYEYEKTGKLTYNLCAEFNKESSDTQSVYYAYDISWKHPAGRYCFARSIVNTTDVNIKPVPYEGVRS